MAHNLEDGFEHHEPTGMMLRKPKTIGKVVDAQGLKHDENGRFSATNAPERDTHAVLKHLSDFYSNIPDENNDYKQMLTRGRFHEPRPLPKGLKPGKAKECFANAYRLASASGGRLRYAEGYAHMGHLPLHHAWALDKDNNVIDPTWTEEMVPMEHRAYYGVPFEPEEAFKQMMRHGTYGIFLKNDIPKKRKAADLFDDDFEKAIAGPINPYNDQRGSERRRNAEIAGLPDEVASPVHGKPHIVMLSGPPGSGKGLIKAGYVGGTSKGGIDFGPHVSYEDLQNSVNNRRGRGMKISALPGFSEDRVADPDKQKKRLVGMYEEGDRNGMRDPSGPRTKADFDKRDDAYKAAAQQHVQELLGYPSVEAFAQDKFGRPDFYGGGLTHEMSSELNKRHIAEMIATPEKGSIVIDQVGNAGKYRDYVKQALANGFGDAIFHHVDSPLEVNHENNSLRARQVAPDVLIGGWHQANNASEELKNTAKELRGQGMRAHHYTSHMASPRRVAGARARGFTENGRVQQAIAQAVA